MPKILGIDPGLTRCGVGLVELGKARKISLVHVEVIRSEKELDLDTRIGIIGNSLEEIIKKHRPDSIAIERVFSQANLSSVMGTAQISGVALYLANIYQIPVAMHTPTEVKAAVTGSGRANKAQVGEMVRRLLSLNEIPKPADASDALAIAICQAFRGATVNSTAYTPAQLAWHTASELAKAKSKR
ncbi:MAG: crossover junction endodeoxyribonuclease RuvC [Actinomycetota bacterium]